jgi:hypothetical protein
LLEAFEGLTPKKATGSHNCLDCFSQISDKPFDVIDADSLTYKMNMLNGVQKLEMEKLLA